MGGSEGNLSGILLSFVLAAFVGLVATLAIGLVGNMGWWSAVGLGAAIAAVLCLFFVVVLGGPSSPLTQPESASAAGSFAAAKAAETPVPPVAMAAIAQPVAAAAQAPKAKAAPAAKPTARAAAKAETPLAKLAAVDDAAVAAAGEGTKPVGLSAPRGGKGDDLKTIEGIGPVLEKLCHDLGIYHFDQIAGWGPGEVAWMNGNLKGFKGRVGRDKWVAQARLIGLVGIEEFKRRAATNDY